MTVNVSPGTKFTEITAKVSELSWLAITRSEGRARTSSASEAPKPKSFSKGRWSSIPSPGSTAYRSIASLPPFAKLKIALSMTGLLSSKTLRDFVTWFLSSLSLEKI